MNPSKKRGCTSARRVHLSPRAGDLLAAAVLGCGMGGAYAQTPVTWVGTTGNYVDASNWSSNATPSNANNEFLMINNGGTANVNPADAAQGNFLTLGASAQDTGNLQISGGTLTLGELRIGGNENIPGSTTVSNQVATGAVVQSGGFVSVTDATQSGPIQSLYIADGGSQVQGNYAMGSYTLTSGDLLSGIATDDAIVVGTGSLSIGSFVQQGGNVTSTGFVIVGRRGATATYDMSGGTLQVGGTGAGTAQMNLWVGDGASADGSAAVPGTNATFSQSNGTTSIRNGLEIGRRGGIGKFDLSGGTVNVTSQVLVGGTTGVPTGNALAASTGTLIVRGTGILNIGTNFNLSLTPTGTTLNSGTGALTMSGGTINMSSSGAIWAVGNGTGASGTADISGGTIAQTGSGLIFLNIGRNNSAGSVKLSGTADVTVNQLTLSSDAQATPVKRELDIEGGKLTVAFWEQGAGNTTSTRTVTVNGTGQLFVTSPTQVHRGGRLVTYNFNGGTASFAGNMPMDTSTMNIAGGAVTFNTLRLQSATTNMSSGSLTVTTVNDNNGNQGGQTTINNGTVNATTWNVTNGTPAAAGLLDLKGGNVTIGTLTTGPGTGGTVHIQGGSLALSIPQLNLSSTTTLKTDNTVSLVSTISLGSVTVNVNTGSLSLTGPVVVPSGGRTLSKTGTGTLTLGGAWTGTAGGINVAAGTLNLDTTVTPTNSINLSASSTTVFRAPGQTKLAIATINNGATATVQANGQRVVSANTFNITGGAKLDIQDNHLIAKSQPVGTLSGTTYSDLTGLIQSGRNGTAWNGPGIVTGQSSAISGNLTSIGIALASDVRPATATATAAWAGQTITGTDVLVMYTYGGDANLDGKINIDDYVRIDQGIAGGLTGWSNGDFNYDGKVNIDDYTTVIDSNIGSQTGAFFAAGDAGGGGSGVTAVPEPVGMGLFGGVAAMLVRRRKRR